VSQDWLVIGSFTAVYLGMALGRWPGLALDRTGVALIGAILLLAAGAVDGGSAARSIDFPTLAILFSLMLLSAQFAASGFFEWCGSRVAASPAAPGRILVLVVGTAGGLAAVLTNDVVVWAMTPILVRGLLARGLDPRPYVIALACAANAGSAATVIGNPQNLLIGQSGGLGFWPFLTVCLVPAVVALALVAGVALLVWRGRLVAAPARPPAAPGPPLDRAALAKALAGAAGIILVFTLPVERAHWALAIAGLLLLSRRLGTRRMLGMVDWHLLLLFAGLFVVTGAFAGTALVRDGLAALRGAGLDLGALEPLLLVSLLGSNSIGNVPLVTLLLSLDVGLGPRGLYALALFSTLSGNLLIVGSIANLIAVEQARAEGVVIGFLDYARIGVPATLLSLAVGWLWLRWALPVLS